MEIGPVPDATSTEVSYMTESSAFLLILFLSLVFEHFLGMFGRGVVEFFLISCVGYMNLVIDVL